MEYNDFKNLVVSHILNYLPDKYENAAIDISSVKKNNGITKDALLIKLPEESITPTIYLDSLYHDMISKGSSIDDVLQNIAEIRLNTKSPDITVKDITDMDNAKNKISMRLINYDQNQAFLKTAPFIRLGNLAAIFTEEVMKDNDCVGTVKIDNNLMKQLNTNIEELHKIALDNFNSSKVVYKSITSMMSDIIEDDELINLEDDVNLPLFVLSTMPNRYGASVMAYPNVLSDIGKKMNSDLYVLPSSVHEVLIVSKKEFPEYDALEQMVKEVNSTEVYPDDILSDTVYEFNNETQQLYLASDHSVVMSTEFLQNKANLIDNDIHATISNSLENLYKKNFDITALETGIEM